MARNRKPIRSKTLAEEVAALPLVDDEPEDLTPATPPEPPPIERARGIEKLVVDLALAEGVDRADLLDPMRSFLAVLGGTADAKTIAIVNRMCSAYLGKSNDQGGIRDAQVVLAVDECAAEMAAYVADGRPERFPLAARHARAMIAVHFPPTDAHKILAVDLKKIEKWLLQHAPTRERAKLTSAGIAAHVLKEADVAGYRFVTEATNRLGAARRNHDPEIFKRRKL